MQKNHFFSTKRFLRYTKRNIILMYPKLLLLTGALFLGMTLIYSLLISRSDNWDHGNWIPVFIMSTLAMSLLYTGQSFPYLRNRMKTTEFLMLPVSVFEKLMYEFLERIILFILVFPTFFYCTTNLAVIFIKKMREIQGKTFHTEYFSFERLINNTVGEPSGVFLIITILFLSLLFAGASTFRKYPVPKTIIFIAIVSVFYGRLIQLLNIQANSSWFTSLDNSLALNLSSLILFSLIILSLSYSYLRIKEKEVD